jgi:hypothetical protein
MRAHIYKTFLEFLAMLEHSSTVASRAERSRVQHYRLISRYLNLALFPKLSLR